MRYLYIFATLFFTIYGQMILKWRILKINWSMPHTGIWDMIVAYAKFLIDPFIFSVFLSAFVASVCWSMAMTKFQITEAYPFMSLAPAIVFLLGVWLLGETFTIGKVVGLVLIIVGLIVTVRF